MALQSDQEPVRLRRGMRVAAAVAILIALGLSTINAHYLGIANGIDASSEGAAQWSAYGDSIWYDESAQREYDQLADAFLNGHLYLDEQPPAWLAQVDNPYDPQVRDAMEQRTGQAAYWDAAYYHGRYYVYFGVVPCLLFFVPFHALTGGAPLPTGIPVDIAVGFYLAGLASLISFVAREGSARVRTSTAVLAYAGAAACSGLVYALMCASLYQIPVACGLAFAVWGLFLWAKAYHASSIGYAVGGGVYMALVLGCRPPLAICWLFGLFPLVRLMGKRKGAAKAVPLGAMAAPFLVVGAAIAWYNAARFGSPTDFGASYNLTVVDLASHGFDADRLPIGAYDYLLQPPLLSADFPYLCAADLDAAWAGGNYVEAMAGGVLASFPFTWLVLGLLAPVGAGAKTGRGWLRPAAALAVGCGIVLALLDAEVGGMVGRYQMDFSFLFGLAASLAALAIADRSKISRGLVTASTALALAFDVLLVLFLLSGASIPTGTGILG